MPFDKKQLDDALKARKAARADLDRLEAVAVQLKKAASDARVAANEARERVKAAEGNLLAVVIGEDA